MAHGDRSPFPADLLLNGKKYLLAEGQNGQKLWEETTPQDVDDTTLTEQFVQYDDWSRGIGVKKDLGVPETRNVLYATGAAADGGGIDGSHGPLLPGPKLNLETLPQTGTVRKIVEFNGAYYAAVDTRVLKSSTMAGWDSASTQFTSTYGNVVDLDVFQGTNSVPRLCVALANGPVYSSADGTTFTVDGDTTGRSAAPKNFSKSLDSNVSFTDYTNNVADTSARRHSGALISCATRGVAAASANTPLSGPTKRCQPSSRPTPRRAPPTPGSTTTRCTVPGGNCGAACASANAAAATSWGGMSWVRSTSVASGAIDRITPFIAPT